MVGAGRGGLSGYVGGSGTGAPGRSKTRRWAGGGGGGFSSFLPLNGVGWRGVGGGGAGGLSQAGWRGGGGWGGFWVFGRGEGWGWGGGGGRGPGRARFPPPRRHPGPSGPLDPPPPPDHHLQRPENREAHH